MTPVGCRGVRLAADVHRLLNRNKHGPRPPAVVVELPPEGCAMSRHRRTRKASPRRWSRQVAERSDALDLQRGVFTSDDPRRIARSLKRSAERSTRRKAKPFQSAMSMLNLYINRAGRTLPATRRRVLERAKHELRAAFGRSD
jgi:type IV secretory pathway VirB10-like protein